MTNQEQFALWSFERDLKEGCFKGQQITKWADLDKRTQMYYLTEANYYLTEHPLNDWPEDILEKMIGK